jgi:hypothetical protein
MDWEHRRCGVFKARGAAPAELRVFYCQQTKALEGDKHRATERTIHQYLSEPLSCWPGVLRLGGKAHYRQWFGAGQRGVLGR